jgi:hypothetical protein
MMHMNVLSNGLIGITDMRGQIEWLKQKYNSHPGDYSHLPGRTWWIVMLKANGQPVTQRERNNPSVMSDSRLDNYSVVNGLENEIMALVRLER